MSKETLKLHEETIEILNQLTILYYEYRDDAKKFVEGSRSKYYISRMKSYMKAIRKFLISWDCFVRNNMHLESEINDVEKQIIRDQRETLKYLEEELN